jgi:transcriptional regulator with XRE-family HTH domain
MQERDYYRRWLSAVMDKTGITQAELGRRVGLERDQINRLLTGKRKWTEQLVGQLAQALSVPHPTYNVVSEKISVSSVRVIGMVNPMVWTENDFEMDVAISIPHVLDSRFEGMEQTAYRVEIDIPGTRISAGTYVITVDFDAARPNGMVAGDLLICSRRRGDLINHIVGVAKSVRANGTRELSIDVPTMDENPFDLTPDRLVIGLFAQLA